ncbi:MAG: hypothetical protein ACE5PV_18630, partial [Candidatus Poribacteria bacterium]
MNEGLNYILNKQEIISTVSSEDLIARPDEVQDDYQKHAYTHIPLGDTDAIVSKLLSRVNSSKVPVGAVVAPYGYGKTSTMVFVWRQAEQRDYIATPPFIMNSMMDILNAVYGWARFRVENRVPNLVGQLDALHSDYTHQTLQERAKKESIKHGVSQAAALGMIRGLQEDGMLSLEITPSRLLRFLDEVASIIQKADFKGLILLPDEIQQYISKSKTQRTIIEELRQFIWGMVRRTNTIGLLVSMPSYAESAIQEAGRDILDRLRKDGLYYNLLGIYGQDFPEQLWNRYVKHLALGDVADKIFGEGTLNAIGQISSREDLGSGPRTVINLFREAIRHFRDEGEFFTPEHLIDTYLRGDVRFEGQIPKIRTAVNEALSMTQIVDTSQKRKAIKLLAAFPNTGCPAAIQRKYGIENAVDELSRVAHGTLISYQLTGYTLRSLLQVEVETDAFSRIVTQFWRTYDEDDLHAEAAERAFAKYVLLRLFPAKRGAVLTSWSGLNKLQLSPTGCLAGILEGTFSDRFPKRKLLVQVSTDERRFGEKDEKCDITFDFYLDWNREPEYFGRLSELEIDHLRFELNLSRRREGALPGDLKRLQEFVNPNRVTPFLMLSLMDFIDRWVDENDVTTQEQGSLNHIRERLLNHSILWTFNEELTSSYATEDFKASPLFTGDKLVERVFIHKCEKLWPEYKTFIVNPRYMEVINDYLKALSTLSPRLRRGSEPISGSKDQLAKLFGYQSNTTFETKAKTDLQHLMKIDYWKGNTGKVRLTLHPLEESFLDALRSSDNFYYLEPNKEVPALNDREFLGVGLSQGYRTEEIGVALQLLAGRGYIRLIRDKNLIILASDTRPAPAITKDARFLLEKSRTLAKLIEKPESAAEVIAQLEEVIQKLETDLDDEELSQIDYRCSNEIKKQVEELLETYLREGKNRLSETSANINNMQNDLFRVNFDEEIKGNLGFVMHLEELRMDLQSRLRRLNREVTRCESSGEGLSKQLDGLSLESDLETFASQLGAYVQKVHILDEQEETLLEYHRGFREWKDFNNRA